MIEFPEDARTPDGVEWFREREERPTIASLSDVHGYVEPARAALTAVEAAGRPPLVTEDDDGRLHWADEDYLLVVNGDLIDRGPANEECIALVERLAREAPPGRVRYHLGNHEMAVLFPSMFGWSGPFSVELPAERRRQFVEAVAEGLVPAAFEGYRYTYSHAGSNEPIDVPAVNETARAAAEDVLEVGTETDRETEREVAERHGSVFGLGGPRGRGADAGLLWMDFEHVTEDAPPQVVGHTRQVAPTRKGSVVCGNVIRSNLHTEGGEAVVLEDPDGLEVVVREPEGVRTTRW